MKYNEYWLEPKHENVRSYYRKAKVQEYITKTEHELQLYSYSTLVAYIVNGQAYITGLYSSTTTRHIKEFFRQYNIKVISSNQLWEDYYGQE